MKNEPNIIEKFIELETLINKHYQGETGNSLRATPKKGQGKVLSILKENPEISQKELTQMLDIRKQSLGEIVSKLEGKGHIQKAPMEKDSRAMMIKLTEQGRKAAEALEAEFGNRNSIFDVLSLQEKEQFEGILDKVILSLNPENKSEIKEEEQKTEEQKLFRGYYNRSLNKNR